MPGHVLCPLDHLPLPGKPAAILPCSNVGATWLSEPVSKAGHPEQGHKHPDTEDPGTSRCVLGEAEGFCVLEAAPGHAGVWEGHREDAPVVREVSCLQSRLLRVRKLFLEEP